jgi:hypothetical protein
VTRGVLHGIPDGIDGSRACDIPEGMTIKTVRNCKYIIITDLFGTVGVIVPRAQTAF